MFYAHVRNKNLWQKYLSSYMLPNLSPSPNLYKVQSVYNNNVASWSLHEELRRNLVAISFKSSVIIYPFMANVTQSEP